MTEQPSTVTCPVCDAPNASRNLFCSECGASLAVEARDATATVEQVTDSQSTAVIPSSRTWADTSSRTHDVEETTVAPVAGASLAESRPVVHFEPAVTESRRGFWLGLIALVLMMLIFAFWIWGGVLAADTRDSLRSLIGMN
jgi:hypothetical protein